MTIVRHGDLLISPPSSSFNAFSSYLDHDGHLAELAHKLVRLAIVDAILESGGQLAPV